MKMAQRDDDLAELVRAIAAYCAWMRSLWRPGIDLPKEIVEAVALVNKLKAALRRVTPDLAGTFDADAPALTFAKDVVDFGVAGLDSPILSGVWNEYFVEGLTTSDVARRVGCSDTTVQRRARLLPLAVATQLWDKNSELTNPRHISQIASTTTQQQERGLQEGFRLSKKESEILIVFCQSKQSQRELGRRAIADELSISENTLKTHIRGIVRKLHVSNMNEAVTKAIEYLLQAS